MRFLKARGVVRALVAVLTLAGLGAALGSAPAGAGGRPESCGLLRTREIVAALGQPAAKGAAGYAPAVCDWRLAATPERARGTLHAQVTRGTQARRDFALARRFHADERQEVEDLGRKAFFAPSLGAVWVLGDRTTAFYLQGVYPRDATPDAAELREAMVDLAETALARL